MSKLLPTHPVKTLRFCYDGQVFCNIALMKPKILLFATLILGSVACTDKAYDPDRMSMEMTFFENEISVPVGSVGPFTVQSLAGKILENIGFGSDEDGYLTANFSKDFFTKSAYEIVLKAPDPSQPFVYDCGSVSFSIGGPAPAISLVGLGLTKQKIRYSVYNPIFEPVTLNAVSSVSCMDISTFQTTYKSSVELENVTLPSHYNATVIQELALPDNVMNYPNSCYLENLKLSVPGDITDKLRSDSPNFRFIGEYFSYLCVKDGIDFKQTDFSLDDLSVPLGRFGFKEAVLKFNLVNTLPLEITLSDIKFLLPKEERKSDSKINEKIEVSGPISIVGGTMDNPGITPVTLRVKALEGTLPDVSGILFNFHVKTIPGSTGSLLSVKQGVSIQSASVSICGGIKLFGDE